MPGEKKDENKTAHSMLIKFPSLWEIDLCGYRLSPSSVSELSGSDPVTLFRRRSTCRLSLEDNFFPVARIGRRRREIKSSFMSARTSCPEIFSAFFHLSLEAGGGTNWG